MRAAGRQYRKAKRAAIKGFKAEITHSLRTQVSKDPKEWWRSLRKLELQVVKEE